MKSTTCRGSNGKYLEEYHSESAARVDAERIKKEFGHELIPSICRTCGYWHLTAVSKSRQCMFCTDSSLFLKDLYATKQVAEAEAKRISKDKRVRLIPYKCPYSSGWHLTHERSGKRNRG